MRLLPPQMRADLLSGVTHFCHCWHITRRDGGVLGLTNHDRDLNFNGIDFFAEAGISVSALDARLGLATPRPEAEGVLSDGHLRADDLAAGYYDGAQFDLWMVDWQNPNHRMLLLAGRFGAVRLQGKRFTVGLKPSDNSFAEARGRLYQKSCDAALGDARCSADISTAPFSFLVAPIDVSKEQAVFNAADFIGLAQTPRWFSQGTILTPAGRRLVVRQDRSVDERRVLSLWQDASALLEEGVFVTLQAGCDKQLTTCQKKFANAINYQGFPDLSDDRVLINIGSAD